MTAVMNKQEYFRLVKLGHQMDIPEGSCFWEAVV